MDAKYPTFRHNLIEHLQMQVAERRDRRLCAAVLLSVRALQQWWGLKPEGNAVVHVIVIMLYVCHNNTYLPALA